MTLIGLPRPVWCLLVLFWNFLMFLENRKFCSVWTKTFCVLYWTYLWNFNIDFRTFLGYKILIDYLCQNSSSLALPVVFFALSLSCVVLLLFSCKNKPRKFIALPNFMLPFFCERIFGNLFLRCLVLFFLSGLALACCTRPVANLFAWAWGSRKEEPPERKTNRRVNKNRRPFWRMVQGEAHASYRNQDLPGFELHNYNGTRFGFYFTDRG